MNVRGSKRPTGKHCRHCKAPEKSVFEETPLLTKYEEKHYTLETNEYNLRHFYDQEKKDLPKEWRPKTIAKDSMKTISMFSRISDNPLNQKWSGYTFMTEHENARIERTYQQDKANSKVDRLIWRKFKKKLKVEQCLQRMSNAGPFWFQDLSPQQMSLIDNLEVALQTDLKESHSGRAQQFLYDLGIWPEVQPKLVAKCVKKSGANVIDFFFLIHKVVVDIETPEYEKKFAESKKTKTPISPYSINERILLTSVFHYHFPTLLKKLDQLLPPPYQEPTVLWGKKPPKIKKRYKSPYLEPLPINEKPWYEERAEEELERKVIRRMKREKETKERQELMDKMKQQEAMLKIKNQEKRIKPKEKEEQKTAVRPGSITMSVFDEDDLINMAALPPRERKSFFFQKYSKRMSTYLESRTSNEEIEEQGIEEQSSTVIRHKSLSPEETKKDIGQSEEESSDRKLIPEDFSAATLEVGSEPMFEEVINSYLEPDVPDMFPMVDAKVAESFRTSLLGGIFGAFTHDTKCLLDTELEDISEDIHLIKAPSINTPKTSSEETVEEFKPKNYWVPLDITLKELTSVSRISSRSHLEQSLFPTNKMSGPPLPDLSVLKNVIRVSKKISLNKDMPMKKPYVVECTDSTCALVENKELPMSEFDLAKNRISTLVGKKQLIAAIKFLCDKGDPLAILPEMELVPWLIRWYDKRRGIKRNLTKADKEELIERSQNLWSAPYTYPTAAPMVVIPEGNYRWNQKRWLMDLINTRLYNHNRAIKHILIDNARDLFPTMFCEYYDTPLNKRFKDTFYAYFPARERDCLVSRPWDPHADKGTETKSSE
ncbi:unnamed protein product [Nezara viridula]|uniref:DUF4770 domain-containing protein n=1 Tax=Nezara viridula TaxID=85310 RepID=A0A9P0MPB0_NEZVI|nr:unnamed protein product [Nezara viridula]